jgi:hypothetical protein
LVLIWKGSRGEKVKRDLKKERQRLASCIEVLEFCPVMSKKDTMWIVAFTR